MLSFEAVLEQTDLDGVALKPTEVDLASPGPPRLGKSPSILRAGRPSQVPTRSNAWPTPPTSA